MPPLTAAEPAPRARRHGKRVGSASRIDTRGACNQQALHPRCATARSQTCSGSQIKRMAHFSDRSSFLDDARFSVAQAHRPPAITTWLATSGPAAAKRRLPYTSPPLTALAALVTDTDIDVATRDDLPSALAVVDHQAL